MAAPERVAQLPSVPTFAELKLPDLNLTSWTGLAAPAGTPAPIIDKLYRAVRTVMADPTTKQAWDERGAILPEAITPGEYQKEIAERIRFFKEVVKANNIVL